MIVIAHNMDFTLENVDAGTNRLLESTSEHLSLLLITMLR